MRHQHSQDRSVQLWYCGDCTGVHLRTEHVSLTLSNDEFAQLSEAVLEMYKQNMMHEEENLPKADDARPDDILNSDLIV